MSRPRRAAPPPVDRIRLVVLDCDGTVCRRGGPVGPRASRAIRALEDRGVAVLFATGRSPTAVRRLNRDLGLARPSITLNGTVITAPASGASPWHHDPFTEEMTTAVHAACREAGLHLAQVDEEVLLHDEDAPWMPESLAIWGFDDFVPRPHDRYSGQATMVFAVGAPEGIARAQARLRRDFDGSLSLFAYPVRRPDRVQLEVRRAGDDKGTGLRRVRERFGLAADQTLAVGDWVNDIPLLEEAAYAVAMSDAPEEVRGAAHVVTARSHLDEGAAEVLEQLFQLG